MLPEGRRRTVGDDTRFMIPFRGSGSCSETILDSIRLKPLDEPVQEKDHGHRQGQPTPGAFQTPSSEAPSPPPSSVLRIDRCHPVPKGPDVIIIESVPQRLQVPLEGGSGTVHRPGGITIGPTKNDPKHPGLSTTIPTALDPLAMIENRQPLPARTVGDPSGEASTMTFRLLNRLAQRVEKPGDATGPGGPSGSGDVDHRGTWYESRKTWRWAARIPPDEGDSTHGRGGSLK